MARQLILDIGREPSYASDEFLVSPSNEHAYAMIDAWPDWPDPVLIVVGPSGSGKSHLGSIWAERAHARIIRKGDGLDPGSFPVPLAALLEDCDSAAHLEAGLFHVLNLVREHKGWLVLTARRPPDLWGLATADLLSRLRRAPLVTIDAPDASLLRAVLVKLFADRQIRIEEDVVAYAARHCEQSLEAISTFVAAVDDDALAAGRRITRPLAVRTIERLIKEKPTPTAGVSFGYGANADDQGPT